VRNRNAELIEVEVTAAAAGLDFHRRCHQEFHLCRRSMIRANTETHIRVKTKSSGVLSSSAEFRNSNEISTSLAILWLRIFRGNVYRILKIEDLVPI